MSTADVDLGQVAAALSLVAVAIGISLWERARLEGDIALAAVRAFVQLTAIGFVIHAIFESDLWMRTGTAFIRAVLRGKAGGVRCESDGHCERGRVRG